MTQKPQTSVATPGIFPGIPDAAYHKDPCPDPSLSCSLIDVLLERSPAHAKAKHPRLTPMEEPEEFRFNLGSAVHAILLHGMQAVCEIAADSYRTAASKEARDLALTQDLYPILAPQLDEARKIVGAIREQIDGHPLLEGVLDPDVGREVTVAWQEAGYGGIWCRCKPDLLLERRVIDLKVTATPATPEAWGDSHAFRMGYHRRALWYRRGLRQVIGVMPAYHFAVIESEPPFALSVFECTNAALDIATREIELALKIWSRCLLNDDWPGYSTDLQWIDPGKGAEYRSAAVVARHQFSMPQDEVQEPFIMQGHQFGI